MPGRYELKWDIDSKKKVKKNWLLPKTKDFLPCERFLARLQKRMIISMEWSNMSFNVNFFISFISSCLYLMAFYSLLNNYFWSSFSLTSLKRNPPSCPHVTDLIRGFWYTSSLFANRKCFSCSLIIISCSNCHQQWLDFRWQLIALR